MTLDDRDISQWYAAQRLSPATLARLDQVARSSQTRRRRVGFGLVAAILAASLLCWSPLWNSTLPPAPPEDAEEPTTREGMRAVTVDIPAHGAEPRLSEGDTVDIEHPGQDGRRTLLSDVNVLRVDHVSNRLRITLLVPEAMAPVLSSRGKLELDIHDSLRLVLQPDSLRPRRCREFSVIQGDEKRIILVDDNGVPCPE